MIWWGVAVTVLAILPPPARAGITVLGTVTSKGYTFTNFDDFPDGTTPLGSNANGISNSGQVADTTFDLMGNATFFNFTGNPLQKQATPLNTGTGQTVFAVNSSGNVVGGNGTTAFYLPNGGSLQAITTPAGAINAFGINDKGNIVGQFTSGNNTPGFILPGFNSNSFTTINQPVNVTSDVINAQGVNNNGLVVGFYLGNDGQVHGFTVQAPGSPGGSVTPTAVTDPTIPTFPQEPGATFVFSQILGINDSGLASGYYGDSTTSQHGYLYNTLTKSYTFLDNPSAQFHNGVEITQITGITNTGELTGFYSDANGVFHSFVAAAVPEPASVVLMGLGVASTLVIALRRRKSAS
jgi:hypothetical protein